MRAKIGRARFFRIDGRMVFRSPIAAFEVRARCLKRFPLSTGARSSTFTFVPSIVIEIVAGSGSPTVPIRASPRQLKYNGVA